MKAEIRERRVEGFESHKNGGLGYVSSRRRPRLGVANQSVPYQHHGIYCGSGRVVHFTGPIGDKANAIILEDDLATFQAGTALRVRRYNPTRCLPPDDVARRARFYVGSGGYSLIHNNCEHFATWCKTGCHESEQVKDVGASGASAVGAASCAKGGALLAGASATAAGG